MNCSSNEFDQLDLLDFFNDTINQSIHSFLVDKLCDNFNDTFVYEDLLFYPVYTRKPTNKVKLLKCVNIRLRSQADYIGLLADEIDQTGANWHEFLDYLYLSDAKLVFYKDVL